MGNFQNIYSLKTIHDLVKKYEEKGEKDKIIIFFDLDFTVIHDKNERDVLIEPQISKELFTYLIDKNIWFTFVTARFYDSVLVKKKRDKIMEQIDGNLLKIHEIFTKDLGMNTEEFINDNNTTILYDEKKKCVGIVRKGIILSGAKGKAIKSYMRSNRIEDERLPIFVDDFDKYLNAVKRELPNSQIFRIIVSNN